MTNAMNVNPLRTVTPGLGSNLGLDLESEVLAGSVLPPANGGTGILGANPTNGQIPIGNTGTATFDNATLTAGFGIGVTNGAGTIAVKTVPVCGKALLTSGDSGVIAHVGVTANSIIAVSYIEATVSPGNLTVTPGAGSFEITSDSATDGSTVAWNILQL
jgi:hypothetical protein